MINESVKFDCSTGTAATTDKAPAEPARTAAWLLPASALPGLAWACLGTAPGLTLGPTLATGLGVLAASTVLYVGLDRRRQSREAALRKTIERQRHSHATELEILKQRQRELLQNFHTSNHRMGQASDPADVMRFAAESLHHTFNFDRVNLLVLNPKGDEIRLEACHGSKQPADPGHSLPFDQRAGILAHCTRERRAMLVEDIRQLPPQMRLKDPLARLPQLRSRSFIICPILAEGHTIALFGVDNKQHRAALEQADLQTVQLFASQVSALLDRLALLDSSGRLTRALQGTFAELSTFRNEYLQLNQDLKGTIDNAAGSADRVAAAAMANGERASETSSSIQEISAAASQLTDNMNLLAQHLEQASSTSAEMAATSREIESRTVQAEELTRRTSDEASLGVEEVAATLEGLDSIAAAMDVGERTLGMLRQLGEQIELLVGAIHDINDRTALLALNAAIIAAQAGEHGRPFAVVAEEIRALAGETGHSAVSIEELVGRLTHTICAMESDFQQTRLLVDAGLEHGRRTSGRLDSILNHARDAGELAVHIRGTTREQAEGSQMLSRTVNQLKDLGQQCLQAIHEQAQGAKRIVQAMEGIETATADTASAADRQREATAQIETIADRINDMARSIFHALGKREAEGRRLAEDLELMRRKD